MAYASGSHAKAVCDICGWDVNYKDLRPHITAQKPDGLKVCPECYDIDNPQLLVGKINLTDPQALYQPRPNSAEIPGIRAFVGFDPVIGLTCRVVMGQVRVTTS